MNSEEKRTLSSKEKKAFYLDTLTEQAKRKFIGRRDFMKASMALGLTATSALLLFQACGGDDATAVPAATTAPAATAAPGATSAPAATTAPAATAVPPTSAPAAEVDTGPLDHLIRRLPELDSLPIKVSEMWVPLEGKTLLNISNLLAHPFNVMTAAGFKHESERVGMDYTGVDSAFDPAKEVENLELGISREFDAVVYAAVDASAGTIAVERIRRAGQVFFNWDSASFARPNIHWLIPQYRTGLIAGKWMGEQLFEGAKVYSGLGDEVSATAPARTKGFVDGIRPYGVEVLATEYGTLWSQEGGYDVGRSMFTRFPEVHGIWAGDDQSALGFAKAAVDVGRRDEVLIVGAEGLKEGQDAIWDGRLDMSVMTRRGLGPEAAMAFLFIEGMLRGNVHGDAIEGFHVIKRVTVTKENIADQWPSPV